VGLGRTCLCLDLVSNESLNFKEDLHAQSHITSQSFESLCSFIKNIQYNVTEITVDIVMIAWNTFMTKYVEL